MKYRRFGRTGFEVSTISLGTVEIGMDYGIAASRPDESEAARLLHRAAISPDLSLAEREVCQSLAEELER